jgi:hypothetical protein
MLGVLPGCAYAQDASWLAGYWLSCTPGREVSETWSDARAGMMIGSAVTLDDGKPSWEFSRIGPSAAGLSYFALPSGQEPAEFPLSKARSNATKLVFENPTHDFPQRVIYAREGGKLSARIEGVIGGKSEAVDWSYVSAPLNQRCPS